MISSKKYLKWIHDNSETNLNLIAVGFNPIEKRRIVQQGGFDLENPISDTKLFSKILSKIIEEHIGNEFNVRLVNKSHSFLHPDLLKENENNKQMRKFLSVVSWEGKKYFGEFTINNIKEFLGLFISYPIDLNYQDIILFSIQNDFVIQISHHGDIWLTSTSKYLLEIIGKKLDSEGATVIYGNTW